MVRVRASTVIPAGVAPVNDTPATSNDVPVELRAATTRLPTDRAPVVETAGTATRTSFGVTGIGFATTWTVGSTTNALARPSTARRVERRFMAAKAHSLLLE